MRKTQIKKIGTVVLIVTFFLLGPVVSSIQAGSALEDIISRNNVVANQRNTSNEETKTIKHGHEKIQERFQQTVFFKILNNLKPQTTGKEEITYEMKIGPYTVQLNLTKEEAEIFVSQIQTIINQKNLDEIEQINQIFDVLHEYEIVSSDFSLSTIEQMLYASNYEGNPDSGFTFPRFRFGEVHNTFGPHFICYISFGGMAVPFHFGDHYANGSTDRIVDLLNISDQNITKILQNISIFQYWSFSTTQCLIGGLLGYFFSMGIFPTMNHYSFIGPFFGIFCPMVGVGLYIYEKHEMGVEKPLIDMFFAFSTLSVVQQYDT